jgi:hypothetical protein
MTDVVVHTDPVAAATARARGSLSAAEVLVEM